MRHLISALLLVMLMSGWSVVVAIEIEEPAIDTGSAPLAYAPTVHWNDVLVVVNNNSANSVQIADYYVAARNIPSAHVVYITSPETETITRNTFNTTILDPVRSHIQNTSAPLNYIVTTKGVPLRISGPQYERASVDSELTLVAGLNESHIGGWHMAARSYHCVDGQAPTPPCHNLPPFSRAREDFFLVTRLTAYNVTTVLGMIDRAANMTGVDGEWVLDEDPNRGYPSFKSGNIWIQRASELLLEEGRDVVSDNTSTYVKNRIGVMGYASWGSNDASVGGVTARPNNTWLNGSIAETFVSTGARSFTPGTSYGQSLVADLLDEGVNAVKGYVYEPGLGAIAHPDLLMPCYTSGRNMAECYYGASLATSWQDVVVGDPKMAPFIENLADPVPTSIAPPILPAWNRSTNVTVTIANSGAATDLELGLEETNGTHTVIHASISVSVPAEATDTFVLPWVPAFQQSTNLTVVVDPDLLVSEFSEDNNRISTTVEIDDPPTITTLTTPTDALRGALLTFTYAATDDLDPDQPGAPELQQSTDAANWSDIPSTFTAPDRVSAILPFTAPMDPHLYRIRAHDSNGNPSDWFQAPTSVQPLNNPTVFMDLNLDRATASRFETFVVTARATDPDTPATDWSMHLQHSTDPTLDDLSWEEWGLLTHEPLMAQHSAVITLDDMDAAGIHHFRIVVLDSDGGVTISSVVNLTLENQLPVADLTSLYTSPFENGTLILNLNATDPDGISPGMITTISPVADPTIEYTRAGIPNPSNYTHFFTIEPADWIEGPWNATTVLTDRDQSVFIELGTVFTIDLPEPTNGTTDTNTSSNDTDPDLSDPPENDPNNSADDQQAGNQVRSASGTAPGILILGIIVTLALLIGIMVLIFSRKKEPPLHYDHIWNN